MENVERFRLIANVLGDLYERKNNAYGNSFGETYGKLGIVSAVTRISDKYNRLCNLVKNPNIDNIGESIEDTLGDMACYCIMTLMERQKEFEINMQKEEKNITAINDDADVNVNVDNEINEGDKFECIKDVVMDDDETAYIKGKTYISERNDCITNEQNMKEHYWAGRHYGVENSPWTDYFRRII
jgi:hypothetical protein